MMRQRLGALVVVAALGLLGACSDDSSTSGTATTAVGATSTSAAAATTSAATASTAVAASATSTPVTAATTSSIAATTTGPKATTTAAAATSTTKAVATTKPSTTTTVAPITGTITVYAAQSLSNAFTDMGKAFEAKYPGASVKFNFAGSSTLVTQIFQGAPADVFASADQPNMDRLVDSGLMSGSPQVFTKNLLQIVVAKGNPKGITGLSDLVRADVVTVLCAPAVPCGNYARQALARQGITVTPRSNEQNVAAVISRVQTGEADAGVAYVTDVLANNRVDGVSIPFDQNVVADYPLASLKGNQNPVVSDAFVTFVKSSAGQAIMAKYSFLPL
ncbi:MAG: molybdate ABC transporter substrate-binding protein [Acidimicrobiia bacterium]